MHFPETVALCGSVGFPFNSTTDPTSDMSFASLWWRVALDERLAELRTDSQRRVTLTH